MIKVNHSPEILQKAAKQYLMTLRKPGTWEFRFCARNDSSLVATCLAAMLGGITGFNRSLTKSQKQEWAGTINFFQREDGWYDDNDIAEKNLCPGYRKDRALLHRTRHALLALYSLNARPIRCFSFIEKWLEPGKIRQWCETLDLADYWYSSNMMMDAALFLMDYSNSTGSQSGFQAVNELLDFCDENINPETGYHDVGKSEIRNAMAGAMHLYPVYILIQRKIKCVDTIIDTTVGLQQLDGLFGYESGSGGEDCLDYDAVFILSNMFFLTDTPKRKKSIAESFLKCLDGITVNQNPDGGFACHRRKESYYFGTLTTEVPPGGSSLWATYARLLAIAMMSKILQLPGSEQWHLNNNLMEIWNLQSLI